ncbi:Ubiquinol-cytochrome c reductase iron-sulfur subunit [Chondrus crispus]|uniref:Cytochrome b-c1 complex subunit Rieske, mitochondrial n=1 Tax=Chondrus crispus TaxID=2769 RepID=R7QDK5_CHOCR|nr:Ubiquinol-cytochrome c reductase iron-sulfur subunit [Chondrus crispus]CDF36597.1 Ubiquinol-cytochrome c reductase iron-sulfur subunit [Chondrus crispus]|eukprot:XP_005716416.1 Ubiquinol-cytochrome c reductase iron-sulfur subunit [Chondrus crispus]
MSFLTRWGGAARRLASHSSSFNARSLPSQGLRAVATSPPTVANAGTLGAASTSTELVSPRGPGALPVGYIDDYHNHPHRYMPGDPTKRAFTYMVLGTTKFIAASAARVLVLKLIYTMSASADVLAMGSVEVELGAIPLGESATIKWRGKPVFIRHRTDAEIELAKKDDDVVLRHPETDLSRVQKPEWLVVVGVCTHLGCVPIANAGDYHGWFCPCHGSHYDISGRIRKGPAPLNLDVPTYRFEEEDTKIILG